MKLFVLSILFPGILATLATLFVRCRLFRLSSPYLKHQVSSSSSFTHVLRDVFPSGDILILPSGGTLVFYVAIFLFYCQLNILMMHTFSYRSSVV